MKWFILMFTLGSDFMILAALMCVFWWSPIIGFLVVYPTYSAWKSTGGLSNWRMKTIRKYLHNWDTVVKI